MKAINCQSCNAPLNLELTRNGLCKCEFCNTTHNLSQEITLKCNLNDRSFGVKLYKVLASQLTLNDLINLTYLMSGDDRIIMHRLNWENLSGQTVSTKCLSMVEWFRMRGCLNVLVESVIKERPMIVFELS